MKETIVPFIKNTKEVRVFLEKKGFTPLSFFQGKDYVYPIISTWANKNNTWKEKDYSTFNKSDNYNWDLFKEVDFTQFIEYISAQ